MVSSDDDGDDVNIGNAEVEAEVLQITTCEALTLLDKLVNLKELNKDERPPFSSIKDRLKFIREILLETSFLLLFLIFVDLDKICKKDSDILR